MALFVAVINTMQSAKHDSWAQCLYMYKEQRDLPISDLNYHHFYFKHCHLFLFCRLKLQEGVMLNK